MAELRVMIEQDAVEIMRLEIETELLNTDDCPEEKMMEILKEVEEEEAEEERKVTEHAIWLKEREEKKLAIQSESVRTIRQRGGQRSRQSGTGRDGSVRCGG